MRLGNCHFATDKLPYISEKSQKAISGYIIGVLKCKDLWVYFLGTKLGLLSIARNNRTCFCAFDLLVQRENMRRPFTFPFPFAFAFFTL
jgi:hypothetical protein